MLKISITILFLLPIYIYCQVGTISGTVNTDSTKSSVGNAYIKLLPVNVSAISDHKGRFTLKNIKQGNYILKVSHIGYHTFQQQVTLQGNQTLNINVYLKDSVIMGREVEVRATKEKNTLEQPVRMNIMTAKNIELLPVQNINELMDYIPGASLSNTFGFFSSKAIVTLRGLPSNDQSRTLVLLDGIPLNKSDEGSVNWNMINKNNIESIDVIKGPGPAKYGSGAMGGVINLISKKPSEKLEGMVLSEYGTYNTLSGNISLNGAIKKDSNTLNKFYWMGSVFGRMSDGYITTPDQFITPEDSILVPTYLKEINTSAKTGYLFKNNQFVEMQFNFFDDIRGNGVKVFDDYGAFSTHRTYSGSMKYSGNVREMKWTSDLFWLRENYIRIYEYMREGAYTLYGADAIRNDIGGNIDFSCSRFSYQNILLGVSYKLGSVDGKDTYYTSTDIISNAGKMQTVAFYIQDEIQLLDEKIQCNASLRYDAAKYFDHLFTIEYPSYSIEFYKNFENTTLESKFWDALCPRLFAQYKFTKEKRIYVSAARGFRAPVLDDMNRTGKKKGGFKVANPELNPELLTSYETGCDLDIIKNLTAGLSIYYSSGKEFMYYTSTGDSVNMGYKISPIFEKRNIGKVEIYGMETEMKFNLSKNFSLFGNYSYTHTQIKEHKITDPKADSDLTGKYLTDIPNHKVSAGMSWENKIVTVSLLYKYIGKVWINEQNIVDENYLMTDRYPDYSMINLRLERNIIKKLSAGVNIENIFNAVFITSDATRSPGRFFSISLKYKI